jgi:hypothetical protein
MIPFLEKTWPLWWMFAAVVILRWFHVLSADSASDADDTVNCEERESTMISGKIASRA